MVRLKYDYIVRLIIIVTNYIKRLSLYQSFAYFSYKSGVFTLRLEKLLFESAQNIVMGFIAKIVLMSTE